MAVNVLDLETRHKIILFEEGTTVRSIDHEILDIQQIDFTKLSERFSRALVKATNNGVKHRSFIVQTSSLSGLIHIVSLLRKRHVTSTIAVVTPRPIHWFLCQLLSLITSHGESIKSFRDKSTAIHWCRSRISIQLSPS